MNNPIPDVPDRKAAQCIDAANGRGDDVVDDMVDDQSDQSFPASDPPSWTLGPH